MLQLSSELTAVSFNTTVSIPFFGFPNRSVWWDRLLLNSVLRVAIAMIAVSLRLAVLSPFTKKPSSHTST